MPCAATKHFSYAFSADYPNTVAQDIRRVMQDFSRIRFSNNFCTHTIDPKFTEPEAGLA
jgi:hypothetical protein